VAGLVFISVVIFMVAPHDPHELKKSLIQGERDLVHRGEMVEAAVVDWVQKTSHLREETAESITDSSLKGGERGREGAATITTSTLPNETEEVDEEEKNRLQTARGAKSKNAYVTLISGIDDSFKYRGFVYSALIMKKALSVAGTYSVLLVFLPFLVHSDGLFVSLDLLLRACFSDTTWHETNHHLIPPSIDTIILTLLIVTLQVPRRISSLWWATATTATGYPHMRRIWRCCAAMASSSTCCLVGRTRSTTLPSRRWLC
jgi:hypothetical protein